MVLESSRLRVKVLRVWNIEKFQGDAILAGVKPRFVIALLLRDSAESYRLENSNVSFMTHRVAFFAIDSVVKLLLESDVEGKQYDLILETEIFNGRKLNFLRLESLGPTQED